MAPGRELHTNANCFPFAMQDWLPHVGVGSECHSTPLHVLAGNTPKPAAMKLLAEINQSCGSDTVRPRELRAAVSSVRRTVEGVLGALGALISDESAAGGEDPGDGEGEEDFDCATCLLNKGNIAPVFPSRGGSSVSGASPQLMLHRAVGLAHVLCDLRSVAHRGN